MSFRELTPEERDGIGGTVLRVVSAGEGEDIQSLSERTENSLAPGLTAIINDVAADAVLSEGDLLKIGKKERY